MELSFSYFFSLMFFAFSFCLLQPSVARNSSTSPVQPLLFHDDECFALLKFKQSLIYDKSNCHYDDPSGFDHNKMGTWKKEGENNSSEYCCSWDGVECDKDSGHVIKLDLTNSCVSGSINSTSTLFHLVHLQWLSLARNNFSHSKIPSQIKNLSKLSYLDLSASHFSGQIPSELLALYQLEHLDLSSRFAYQSNSIEYLLQLQQPGLRSLVEKLTNLKLLDLNLVNISSPIPNSLGNLSFLTFLNLAECGLQGTIPSSIGNLTKLVYLDISGNEIFDKLPASIGNLNSLQVMIFSYNQLSSQTPSTLGNLTQLTDLVLSFNNFSSENCSSWSWIAKLTKLTQLELGNVNLAGEIPFWLINLIHLTYLDMSFNQLSGPIPLWLMSLNRLSYIYLTSNQLTDHIPSEISNLTQLNYLDLSLNQLQGQIPSSIIELQDLKYLGLYSNKLNGTVELDMYILKMKSLEVLVLSSNNLSVLTKNIVNTTIQQFISIGLSSCNLTTIPNFLQNQNSLSALDLSSNNIHGQIPGWLLNISGDSLESLNLSHNHFTRFDQHSLVLPMQNLVTLDLSFNKLQGSLPLPPSSITYYLAANNKLRGEIPPEICHFNRLHALDLSYNNLSGELPRCLGNISYNLSMLALQANNFYGQIPETLMIGPSLKMIDLSHNKFQGKIPRSLANCISLEFLNLGYNQITDIFPSWLGLLPELKVLILKFNRFHGVLTESKTNLKFVKLRIIDLSQNLFTGELPSKYFEYWNSMKIVNGSRLTYMEDRFTLSSAHAIAVVIDFPSFSYAFMMNNKGIEITYGKISNKLTSISLSGNRFTGEIPTSISDLRALKNLNLSNNDFIGSIPSSLYNLTELESLDLSNNRLSGEIPQQLATLTSLAFINVSQNNLGGAIPQGPQFNTFENTSFEGNPSLCGKPLSKRCGNSEALEGEEDGDLESAFAFDWKIVLIGFVSGLIVGVVLGNEFCTEILIWFATIFGKQLKIVKRNRRCTN